MTTTDDRQTTSYNNTDFVMKLQRSAEKPFTLYRMSALSEGGRVRILAVTRLDGYAPSRQEE